MGDATRKNIPTHAAYFNNAVGVFLKLIK